MSHPQLNQSDFERMEYMQSDAEKIAGESTSYWKDAWRRFRKNKLALFGVFVIIFLGVMSFAGESLSGHNYYDNDLMMANQSPSAEHWFGTDNLGRDIFARTWYGAKISLFIGLMAAFIDVLIGIIWGSVSGYLGGKVDRKSTRLNSSHVAISYAVFCLTKKIIYNKD